MMTKAKDKIFGKRLFLLALPIIGQDVLNALINMIDTFMAGHIGSEAIPAIGLGNQIFMIFITVVSGISGGTATLMGQFFGAGDVKSVRKSLGIGVFFSVITAAIFMLIALSMPETIMGLYSNDPVVISEGAGYIKIAAFSYILCAFIVPTNTALKSIGRPGLPFTTTTIVLVLNVILNYIFIYVLELGVEGVAMATVIARATELILQLTIIKLSKVALVGKLKEFVSADKALVKKFALVAGPVVINVFFWVTGTSLYNVAYSYLGTDAQTSIQITNSIWNVFWVVGMGVGSASGIILANELGAGKIERSIGYSRQIMKLVVFVGVGLALLFLLLAPMMVNIYDVSNEIKDFAQKNAYVFALIAAFRLMNFTIFAGILRSGGDTVFVAIVDFISVWLVGLPLAFLGAYYLGLPVYFTLLLVNLEEVFKFSVGIRRVLKNGWARSVIN